MGVRSLEPGRCRVDSAKNLHKRKPWLLKREERVGRIEDLLVRMIWVAGDILKKRGGNVSTQNTGRRGPWALKSLTEGQLASRLHWPPNLVIKYYYQKELREERICFSS